MSEVTPEMDWDEFLKFVEMQLALDSADAAQVGSSRLMREVRAKQGIIQLASGINLVFAGEPSQYFLGYVDAACEAVLAMAQVYSNKPGWKREWVSLAG